MIRRVSPQWVFLILVAAAYLLPQETAGEWAVKSRLVAGAVVVLGGTAVLRGGSGAGLAWVWLALGGWTALAALWSLDAVGSLTQALAIAGAAAIVIFPISYILGDIFTEVYGYQCARQGNSGRRF